MFAKISKLTKGYFVLRVVVWKSKFKGLLLLNVCLGFLYNISTYRIDVANDCTTMCKHEVVGNTGGNVRSFILFFFRKYYFLNIIFEIITTYGKLS